MQNSQRRRRCGDHVTEQHSGRGTKGRKGRSRAGQTRDRKGRR
jgi:hypothetical protein